MTLHMDITRQSILNQINYTLCSQRWINSIQSAKKQDKQNKTKQKTPQNQKLTGSNHPLLIAKFRLKLKKVEKTTRLFRYDLNQIPYDYTVGVTNSFNGLDLKDRVPEELWMEVHNIVQELVIKIIPKKKKCKKGKMGV